MRTRSISAAAVQPGRQAAAKSTGSHDAAIVVAVVRSSVPPALFVRLLRNRPVERPSVRLGSAVANPVPVLLPGPFVIAVAADRSGQASGPGAKRPATAARIKGQGRARRDAPIEAARNERLVTRGVRLRTVALRISACNGCVGETRGVAEIA